MSAQRGKRAPLRRGGILALALGFIFLAGACAKRPPKRPKPRPKVEIPAVPTPPPVPRSLTPQREASQKIVQAGKEYLSGGDVDKAAQTFQEAINVDPENGVAYFFLSFALYRTQSYEEAIGLLDRAEALLNDYPEWEEEVFRLRYLIEQAKAGWQENKEEEREGYY